jgi:hypothetical protein
MTRSALAIAAAAAAVVLALPHGASADRWTAPDAATVRGTALAGGIAIDPRGRLALGLVRSLDGVGRAEVRTGTVRGGLRGGSLVVDRDPRHALGAPVVAWPGDDGTLALGWLALQGRNRRVRAATVTPDRRVTAVRPLTGGGESAYEPRFVPGTAGDALLLAWGRRSTNEASAWDGGTWGAVRRLPGEGIGSLPVLARDRDGTLVAVWTLNGDVLAAQAPPGQPFGPSQVLGPDGGYARDPAVAITRDGHALAAWVASDGTGNAVLVSARPRGGTFGPPVVVDGHDAGARAPRLVASSSGAFALAYVTTSARRGDGAAAGVARLRLLRPDGQPTGPRVRLSPDGERTREVAVADDGTSAIHAVWALTGGGTGIRARRVAPGPIVGRLRTLSRRRVIGPPVLAGGTGGGPVAALAFSWNGRVYVTRYEGG